MRKKLLILILATLLLSVSCGSRRLGWGVVLWSPDETALQTGEVLPLVGQSRIDNIYTLRKNNEDIEIQQWRVDFFEEKETAETYAKEIEPFSDTYALVEVQGLPMREATTTDSDRVYRLRKNQTLKIVHRETEEINIGSLTGSWYRTLTEDGSSGFCFSAALLIYTPSEIEAIMDERNRLDDPLLENFLDSVWRPDYFQTMLTRSAIDLTRFSDQYSLMIDRDAQVISLILEDAQITESYNQISVIGPKTYLFEGSTFQVFLNGNTDVYLTYSQNGTTISRTFVKIDRNIEEIIENELLRRENLLNDLNNRGDFLTSTAYGTIEIDEKGNFLWKDFDLLKNLEILSDQSGDKGSLSFQLFTASRLRHLYEGVMTFTFTRNAQQVHFLYSYTSSGIQLLYIPPASIENRTVIEEPRNPTVMFFAF